MSNEIKPSRLTGLVLDYKPEDDGITHINAYSKSPTKLGKELSNFAQIGFNHPKYGKFVSVEAFWYWLSTGQKHDHLKLLSGFKAKEEGRKYPKVEINGFRNLIEEALILKIKQNKWLYEAFKENTLPITHYFVFGSGNNLVAVQHETTPWLEYFYARFKNIDSGLFKDREAQNIIIDGSRDIDDYNFISHFVLSLNLNIKSIISGGAKGVDKLAERFAKDRNIPLKEFKADWDKYDKAAGFLRNEIMAKEGDALVSIWDGISNGTKHMRECMLKLDKPVYSLTYRKDNNYG